MPSRKRSRPVAAKIGLWINFAHHVIAEVVAHSGFDWLLFDMEHTPNDLQIVGQQLLAVRGTPTAPIVRVPVHDMAWIKRVLDAGAPNVMVPNIRSVAEAREAVSWTRFPPRGCVVWRAARGRATTPATRTTWPARTTRSA